MSEPGRGDSKRWGVVLDQIRKIYGAQSMVDLKDAGEDPDVEVERIEELHLPIRDTGRYDVAGQIAEGGVGRILKCRDRDLGRDVAMKLIREEVRDDPSILRRFVEEAQIGGQLQHPGIVQVYELGLDEKRRPYFTMRLVKGRTLAAQLEDRADPMEDQRRFLQIFEQVCQTIAYAHARGVVHRDLKPANVMIASYGTVKIVDWGFAKVLRAGGVDDEKRASRLHGEMEAVKTVRSGRVGSQSVAGSVMGTPAYMPPEQAQGHVDQLDERSDVFSLGAILTEILTGAPPYVGADTDEVLRMASSCALEGAKRRLWACGLEQKLMKIALSCLSPSPKSRPRHAGILAREISSHLTSVNRRAKNARILSAKAAEAAQGERKARKLTIALTGVLLLALIVGGGGFLFMQAKAQDRIARRALEVDNAVDRARFFAARARAAEGYDSAMWGQALDFARQAQARAADASVKLEPETLARVRELQEGLEAEAKGAAELSAKALSDEKILAQLREARARKGDDAPAVEIDNDYARAFRDYGIDVERLSAKGAADRVAASGMAAELAAALDEWAVVRSRAGPERAPKARHLVAVASAADPDWWRNELRHAASERNLNRLRTLAQTVGEENRSASSLSLLGHALGEAGDEPGAIVALLKARDQYPDDLWVNFNLAYWMGSQQRWRDAIRFYTAALALRPECLGAWNNLGIAFLEIGETARAVDALGQAVKRDENFARGYYNLGLALQAEGKLTKAIAAFEKAVDLEEGYVKAMETLAFAYQQTGDPLKGVILLEESAKTSRDPAIFRSLARLREDQGRRKQAIDALWDATRYDQEDALSRYHLGRLFLLEEDPEKALSAFDSAIDIDPHQMAARRSRVAALDQLGQLDHKIVEWREKLANRKSDPLLHLDLGLARERRLDIPGAIREYEATTRLAEDAAWAWNHLAYANTLIHDYPKALKYYRKAAELEPKNADILNDLGATYHRLGDRWAAIAAYRRVIRLRPADATAWYNLAFAAQEVGNRDEALRAYRRTLDLKPDHEDALTYLVPFLCSYAQEEYYEEAVNLCVRAIRRSPDLLDAHTYLGYALGRTRSKDIAEAAYLRRVRNASDEARAGFYNGLASMLWKMRNDPDGAIAAYREALLCQPDEENALGNYVSLLLGQGRHDEAIEACLKVIEKKPEFAKGHQYLGRALRAKGDPDRGVEAWRRAFRLKPDDATLRNTLVNALHARGTKEDMDEAVKISLESVKADPLQLAAHSSLGYALGRRGDREEAIALYDEQFPDSPVPTRAGFLQYLGNGLYQSADLEGAIGMYRRSVELDPERQLALPGLATTLLLEERNEEAVQACLDAIERKPDLAGAHNVLGSVLRIIGEKDRAVAARREAYELQPDQFYTVYLNALYARDGEEDRAEGVRVCLDLVRRNPGNTGGHLNLGFALCRHEGPDRAREIYAAEVEGATAMQRSSFLVGVGRELLVSGDIPGTQKAFWEALRLQPMIPGYHLGVGRVVGRLEDPEPEVRRYEREMRESPPVTRAWFFAGLASGHYQEKRYREAAEAAGRALRLDAANAMAHQTFGLALGAHRGFDEAIAAYRELETPPSVQSQAAFFAGLGGALYLRGDLGGAIAAYREVIVRAPTASGYRISICSLLNRVGRSQEAVAAAEEFVQVATGQQASAQYVLGNTRWIAADLAGAIEAYEEAIQHNASYAWAHYDLGVTHLYRGDFRAALVRLVQGTNLLFTQGYAREGRAGGAAEAVAANARLSRGWVRECRRMLELAPGLDAIRKGGRRPASPDEALDFARLCFYSGYSAAAVRLYESAFEEDPSLAEDLDGEYRYEAARAAAMAGSGEGRDAKTLGDDERRRLRLRALAWLREDLAGWRETVEETDFDLFRTGGNQANHWRFGHVWCWPSDPHLRFVRDSESLEKLPKEERAAWRDLWDSVDMLCVQAMQRR